MRVCLEFDDFHKDNHRLDLLMKLKEHFPGFKVTMFAIPANCPDEWTATLPDWIELAYHGWAHVPRECERWDKEKVIAFRHHNDNKPRFVKIFRPPYWLISDYACAALDDAGYKMCLHPDDPREKDYTYNWNLKDEPRLPWAIQACKENPGYVVRGHGHVQPVCDNGLEESLERIMKLPQDTEFLWVSEVIALQEGENIVPLRS